MFRPQVQEVLVFTGQRLCLDADMIEGELSKNHIEKPPIDT
jgi:hypothetical protein